MATKSKHIVLVKAKNDLTVLNRIVTVVRKRRFVLEGFSVNWRDGAEIMEVTMVVDDAKQDLNQVKCQLAKLIDVYEVK